MSKTDKFRKTHRYRASLLRDVTSVIRFEDGTSTDLPQRMGEFMFRTAAVRDAWLREMNEAHPGAAVALPNAS